MTLNQIVAIAADTTFQSQCKAAAVFYAVNTAIRAAPTAHNIADELQWALASSTIADGCAENLPRFVWAIANSNAGTFTLNDTGDANDPLIQSALGNLWAEIAGVNPSMGITNE
jgi:hypothetical protein